VETPSTVARVETQFAESGRTPVGVSDIVDLGSASAYEVNLVEDEPTSSEDGVQTPLTKTKSPPQSANSTSSPALTEVYEKSQSTTAGSQQQHLKLYNILSYTSHETQLHLPAARYIQALPTIIAEVN